MASLIPDYEYDIFISYRQKDNKGERWVSDFVDALKTELESTFKEEISVYFDINPHDGLLETHDVDASVKDKLKCLVFVPVISRTYCDPKSFAWEHEFKAFVEQSSQHQFGLKVKLPDGNVANRVLPVRIHDLDNEDIRLCESLLGGVLRGIEFIYRSAGVNRPLRSEEEKPHENLNHTIYRDQINKVANAIKEIISGLRTAEFISGKEKTESRMPWEKGGKNKILRQQRATGFNNRKLLSGILITAILIIAAILIRPIIFKQDTFEKLRSSGERISVAVMPFKNMTNDTIWNVWQDGIQNELINNLTNSEELKVRQIESISTLIQSKSLTDYASITPSVASTLSQKLDANIFIYGSIKQAGAIIRINAQLIDTKTREAFKSFQIDGKADSILHVIDSLSVVVKNFLIISKLEKQVTRDFKNLASTKSPEAYRNFTYGQNALMKGDFRTACNLLSQAVAIDSNFVFATICLSIAYSNQGLFDQGKKWCLKVYEKRDQMLNQQKIYTNQVYAFYFETPYEQVKYLKQLQEFDDQMPTIYIQLGIIYNRLYQYDKAIPEFEKALEIYNKWDSRPLSVAPYIWLGFAYHKSGQYEKEKTLYKKVKQDFPDDPKIICSQAILSLTEGDTTIVNGYIEKLRTILKDNSYSAADITTWSAFVYSEAGIMDKAEEYYRKALSFEPENAGLLNNLAAFYIINDRKVNEGFKLIDKALKLSPDNYDFIDTKGWGLYKQGKYKEALKILQKSWDLRKKNAIYDHEAYLHLEAAKKAVAEQGKKEGEKR